MLKWVASDVLLGQIRQLDSPFDPFTDYNYITMLINGFGLKGISVFLHSSTSILLLASLANFILVRPICHCSGPVHLYCI